MSIRKDLADHLRARAKAGDRSVLRGTELKSIMDEIKVKEPAKRAAYGKAVNEFKKELISLVENAADETADEKLAPIDVTAPWDVNTPPENRPKALPATDGSVHPLTSDQEEILNIFGRMGFNAIESRQLDDDWHMFTSLNFPEDHPARDDYDSFITVEKDKNGRSFVAPAHTSTMQNRVLKQYKNNLKQGQPIAVVIAGRVFRNEDVDARHEHTFQQLEGVYVDKGIHAGHLIATLKTFLEEYYQKELDIKTQPFYFPFTEPSFEFAMSCPFCEKKGCNVCSHTGWIEILGCGMIHPNVLKMADIDPAVYTGFAWGVGTMRLTMMKYGIEDIRHFNSAKLDFLRQFK